MTWFDQKICTLKEAQKTAGQVPGFLQLGDQARLWIDDTPAPGHYVALDCWIVGVKVGFQSKFFYDVAVPLGDSGFCAVFHEIYGYVTPPHVQTFDPAKFVATDIHDHIPEIRRQLIGAVRSEQEHASQVAASTPMRPSADVIPLRGSH